ncbi:hypothetical protein GJ496_003976 [Pomphorhynchus laevis]|nr:hypothetical protein GJ496_003976 [Pomphorhynchus laevis]
MSVFDSYITLDCIRDYDPLAINLQVFLQLALPDKSAEYAIGVDEAGRGPALGPLIYCAFITPKQHCKLLESQFKCKDSKNMTSESREDVLAKMSPLLGEFGMSYVLGIISPCMISRLMLAREENIINLNLMSHRTVCTLLHIVFENKYANVPISIYLDTVGPCEKYRNIVYSSLKSKTSKKVIATDKAESKYKCVAAASIFAKVNRDFLIPINCGSGYPADPNTKEFLRKSVDPVFGFNPNLARFSWSTISSLLDQHCYRVKWEDDLTTSSSQSTKSSAKRLKLSSSTPSIKDIRNFFSSKETKKEDFFKKIGFTI